MHCDNSAGCTAWESGTCRHAGVMALICSTMQLAARHNFCPLVRHVAGVDNSIADALSRASSSTSTVWFRREDCPIITRKCPIRQRIVASVCSWPSAPAANSSPHLQFPLSMIIHALPGRTLHGLSYHSVGLPGLSGPLEHPFFWEEWWPTPRRPRTGDRCTRGRSICTRHTWLVWRKQNKGQAPRCRATEANCRGR